MHSTLNLTSNISLHSNDQPTVNFTTHIQPNLFNLITTTQPTPNLNSSSSQPTLDSTQLHPTQFIDPHLNYRLINLFESTSINLLDSYLHNFSSSLIHPTLLSSNSNLIHSNSSNPNLTPPDSSNSNLIPSDSSNPNLIMPSINQNLNVHSSNQLLSKPNNYSASNSSSTLNNHLDASYQPYHPPSITSSFQTQLSPLTLPSPFFPYSNSPFTNLFFGECNFFQKPTPNTSNSNPTNPSSTLEIASISTQSQTTTKINKLHSGDNLVTVTDSEIIINYENFEKVTSNLGVKFKCPCGKLFEKLCGLK
ncbi:hypothetical protein HDU92_008183, partial [Lobulomyces angularis]